MPANIQETDLLERIKQALHQDLSQEDLAAFGVGRNRGPPGVRAGYLTDLQMAAVRGKSTRAQRDERHRGVGPPWTRDGRDVLYSIEAYRRWLASHERQPVREPSAPVRRPDANRLGDLRPDRRIKAAVETKTRASGRRTNVLEATE